MSQQYSLRWNNHQPNFISMFTSLLNTQTLVDVTLAAEGKHLRAHKVVLSACSTYFQSVLVDNPSQHPIVILKDVTFANLRIMVDFMYYGEVNVTEEQLPQVLETAKLLKIKGLTEMPESTSLTRSQGTSVDFQEPCDSIDSQRHANSPQTSPTSRRKRPRKWSSGSGQCNVMGDERQDDAGPSEVVRETITLSHVPRRRDIDDRLENQLPETENMNVEALNIEANQALTQGGQWSMMEHAYPRYNSTCGGGGGGGGSGGAGAGGGGAALHAEPAMYMCNALTTHMGASGGGGELHEYSQMGVGDVSAGPSCAPDMASRVPTPDHAHQHTPVRRRRTTNPQSEENFQRALEAVRFGGIGFCKAARLFGVNNRTLWLEYKKKGYPTMRQSIRNRIKRETTTPPRELKEDPGAGGAVVRAAPDQMALLCAQQPVPVNFMEARPLDFPDSSAGLKLRRSKNFRRQSRVNPEEREVRKQASEPAPATPSAPVLMKHESYPQYSKNRRSRTQDHEVGSLLIRAVTAPASSKAPTDPPEALTPRASHTPAVRSGPPLSCNFCWNTVDESGRILRRKTQYHCPECRTNLCIVPCFHEYHDGPKESANVR